MRPGAACSIHTAYTASAMSCASLQLDRYQPHLLRSLASATSGPRVDAWSQPEDAQRVIDHDAPKRARRDVYIYFDNDMKVRAPATPKG